GSGRGHAVAVDLRKLFQIIDAGHQVFVDPAAPILADLVDVLLAEAGTAARIGHRDDIALGGPDLGVPAITPRIRPRALRTTVHEIDERPLLVRIEAGRFEDPHLHRRAAGALDRNAFGFWQIELC